MTVIKTLYQGAPTTISTSATAFIGVHRYGGTFLFDDGGVMLIGHTGPGYPIEIYWGGFPGMRRPEVRRALARRGDERLPVCDHTATQPLRGQTSQSILRTRDRR